MGARQKLNSAALLGNLVFAGLIGLVTQSATVFVVAFVVLIACSVHSGDMRVQRRTR